MKIMKGESFKKNWKKMVPILDEVSSGIVCNKCISGNHDHDDSMSKNKTKKKSSLQNRSVAPNSNKTFKAPGPAVPVPSKSPWPSHHPQPPAKVALFSRGFFSHAEGISENEREKGEKHMQYI